MTFNKIFGASLAILLTIMGLGILSDMLFGKGHHHAHIDKEKTLSERVSAEFSYYPEIADAEVVKGEEPVFDLGALLAAADVSRGERAFQQKCSSCHTVDQGGANGTGPNMWDKVGKDVASKEGFNYSSTMASWEGAWTYDQMNGFLENPRGYMPGTAMAFAGLRKDPERVNVIAYLASLSNDPEPFPAPLAAEEPAAVEVEGGVDADLTVETVPTDAVELAVPSAEAAVSEIVEQIEDGAEAAASDAEDAATDLIDQAEKALEEADPTE